MKLYRVLYILLIFAIAFSLFQNTRGAQSNPGHPWTQIDEGEFAVSSTPLTAPRMYVFPDANATVLTSNAAVTTAQGGTGVTSAGTAGNVLTSDGSNWLSSSTQRIAFLPVPIAWTGAVATSAIASLTTSTVMLFNLPHKLTVNRIAYNVTNLGTAGTNRICVYTENGQNKLIDVTSPTNIVGVVTTTVAGVTLLPGNYYITIGCATTCGNGLSIWTTTAIPMINGASVTGGKQVWEGIVTRASGVCNATLGTITGGNNSPPVVRLDN
jgi:hypothetical protein